MHLGLAKCHHTMLRVYLETNDAAISFYEPLVPIWWMKAAFLTLT